MRPRLLAITLTLSIALITGPFAVHAAKYYCQCKKGTDCAETGDKPSIESDNQIDAAKKCDEACFQILGDPAQDCFADAKIAAGQQVGGAAPPLETPGAGSLVKLQNPLGENVTIPLLVGRIINAALGIVGSIAFLMFIYGGFKWLTSAGNEQSVREGTDVMKWAIVGLVIVFTSVALVRFVLGSIGALG
jgi:hypothetical protein